MSADEVSVGGSDTVDAGADAPRAARFAALLDAERANGFAGLRGSRADIAVPVRQAFVDWLVDAALARRGATGVRVELLEGARLGVEVTHRVLGVPARVRTVLTIEPDVDLRHHRIVLRHADSLLWRTTRTIVGALGLLPPGVSFGPGAVGVDLRALAERAGWAEVLAWLQRLRFEGPVDGLLVVDAALEIQPPREAGPPPTPAAHRAAPTRAVDVDALLAHLAGSRAHVEVHVSEALANEAIAAGRSLAQRPLDVAAPAASLDVGRWAAFVGDVAVRFEAGRLVASAEILLPDEGPS